MSRTRRGEDSRDDATGPEGRESDAERALREALRAEPSAALIARVRAELSRPRPVRMSPLLAAVAATVVVTVGLAILRLPTAVAPEARWSPPQAAQGGVASLPIPPAPAVASETVESRSPPRRLRHADAETQPRWPTEEILVEPGQAEALVQLADLALAGQLALPYSLLDPDADLGTLPPPEPLRVEPLVITPLDSAAVVEPGLSGRGDL